MAALQFVEPEKRFGLQARAALAAFDASASWLPVDLGARAQSCRTVQPFAVRVPTASLSQADVDSIVEFLVGKTKGDTR
ncbi:hypothetical protein [Breoghania sp.]|uniref:hypothetical protein n=1 Tax=Breoghania sp. TaxID=2065378 RepID=UPI0029C9DADB|nr:hypothetical protein [Breoghania sp.]